MKGRKDGQQAGPAQQQPAQQHVDDTLDRQVQEYSKLYSIDQWLQPRSMVEVQLAKFKEETRCPMCFGKIRNARISMACLHRYCAKCIEQYLRAKMPGRHGDEKECPVCRAHLHSRRATKPDPAFDKIIKALYGDVDQFDAEEEALIEADNKAHMKAWQAQLADMKARQAAAVAAAKAAGPPPAPERKLAAGGGMPRPSSLSHLADADGAGSGRGNSKKRSYAAAAAQYDEDWEGQEGEGQYFKAARTGGAGTYKGGASGAGGSSKRSGFEEAAAAAAGDEGPWGGAGGEGLAGMGSGGLPKKKKKPGVSVARLIGLAAQAAAAEGPPPRFCVVQLMPEQQLGQQQQQQAEEPAATAASSSSSAAAAAAAGRPEGRSRKPKAAAGSKGKGAEAAARQPLQHLPPGQVAAPSIDRPFLACPVACTVAELKKMLLQQLSQQGTTAQLKSSFEVHLVQGQQRGLLGGSSSGSEAGSGVLADALTVGQLRDKGGCLGPDVLVQYRLVGV